MTTEYRCFDIHGNILVNPYHGLAHSAECFQVWDHDPDICIGWKYL